MEEPDIFEQAKTRRLGSIEKYFLSKKIEVSNKDLENYEKKLKILEDCLYGEGIPIPNGTDIFILGMNYISRRKDVARQTGVHYNDINPFTNPANYVKNIIKAVMIQGSHTKAGISRRLGKDELKEIGISNQDDYMTNLRLFVNPKFRDCFNRRFLEDRFKEREDKLKEAYHKRKKK